MLPLTVKEIFRLNPQAQTLEAQGWVRTKRESKSVTFLEINDGSCLRNLQVVLDETMPGYLECLARLSTGASVKVQGKWVASPGEKQKAELRAEQVKVFGLADPDHYPLQKKRHSFEFLREVAHLRPRTNTIGAVARVRNALTMAIHQFFQDQGFIFLATPIITASDCEGAGEMFQVTTLPLGNLPRNQQGIDYSQDFFGRSTALTVSGQLEAECYALALGKVYTFGPTFRAEHSETSRHLAEFWMVEPEMAFCDIYQDMDLAEAFLKFIFQYVLDHCSEDMEFFNQWIDKSVIKSLEQVVKEPFARITYSEAIKALQQAPVQFEFMPQWGADLQSEHEKYLTEKIFKKPVMVTDYPQTIKAFYMKQNPDGKTVRALDVHVPRLGEIIGGSEREDDYDHLLARIQAMGLNPQDYWWYLDLRKYGSTPHAGFGLGFERALQFVTGMTNIRDVIPFPRFYRSAEF